MTTLREAAQQALEALENCRIEYDYHGNPMDEENANLIKAITALKAALAEPVQEPVAWMGTDIEGHPNKFRLHFFSGGIPLFALPEDRNLIADREKNGSPCPEFWDWLPKAYNFDGLGEFTKYNMEVAFLAGKNSVPLYTAPPERAHGIGGQP